MSGGKNRTLFPMTKNSAGGGGGRETQEQEGGSVGQKAGDQELGWAWESCIHPHLAVRWHHVSIMDSTPVSTEKELYRQNSRAF